MLFCRKAKNKGGGGKFSCSESQKGAENLKDQSYTKEPNTLMAQSLLPLVGALK